MSVPRVVVDPDSGLAPWRQIHRQLAHLIGSGQLAEGERLPTVRQLARDLGVAAGTVARVYRELEEATLITTARGKGTVVAGGSAPVLDPAVATAARAYVEAASAAGADLDDAMAALVVAWR